MERLKGDAWGVLSTWLRNTPTPAMIMGQEGNILWANEAMEHWSGYTYHELQRSPMALLAPSEDRTVFTEALNDCLAGKRDNFVLRQRWTPQHAAAQWGELTVIRFPESGEMQYMVSTWRPLTNGTAKAFEAAMTAIEQMKKSHAALTKTTEATAMQYQAEHQELLAEIRESRELSKQERFLLSTWHIVCLHPKTAWALFIILLTLAGFDRLLAVVHAVTGAAVVAG